MPTPTPGGADPALPRVIGTPTLPPFLLTRPPARRRLPALFRSERVRFYHQGRYAIWHALRVLGLRAGENVLFPALHCATELDPFLELGVEARFYEAEEDLVMRPRLLEGLVDAGTRAVFVIHYFGLAQPMEELESFCRGRGLRLIEDCAHTLPGMAGGAGAIGDVSIFSLRKLLPMPDGGALCVNDPGLPMPDVPSSRPPLRFTLREVRRKVGRGAESRGRGLLAVTRRRLLKPALGAARRLRRRAAPAPAGSEDLYAFHPDRLRWRLSRLSAAILYGTDFEQVATRRRENFNFLLRHLPPTSGVLPAARRLAADACPWMLPIIAPRPQALISFLLARGIEMGTFWQYRHPAFPAARFPQAALLKERLLALPVHQQLGQDGLDRIVEALVSWGRGLRA